MSANNNANPVAQWKERPEVAMVLRRLVLVLVDGHWCADLSGTMVAEGVVTTDGGMAPYALPNAEIGTPGYTVARAMEVEGYPVIY